jgi:hypothetical protein
LLQLNWIAKRCGQGLREIDFDINPATDHFAAKKRNR